MTPSPNRPDQAAGLRKLFGQGGARFIAVVANPDVAFAGLALERLATACAQGTKKVLVVDAASSARLPHELAAVDLAACIEPLAPHLEHLAARGLPLAHVNARGSSEGFLEALADAAPQAAVIVVHADAPDIGRLFARREICPLLLAADHPDSVTGAYANMKLLAQRHGLMAFDLLLVAAAHSPRTPRIAQQLALTAERFCGAAIRDWAVLDPGAAAGELPAALLRIVRAQPLAEPLHMPYWQQDAEPAFVR